MLSFVTGSYFAAFFTSLLLTPLVRRMAPALGLVDQPGDRKVHVTPTPMGGGIAVFLGVLVPALLIVAAPATMTSVSSHFSMLADSVVGNTDVAVQLAGICAGAVVLFVMGLADDRWNLPMEAAAGGSAAGGICRDAMWCAGNRVRQSAMDRDCHYDPLDHGADKCHEPFWTTWTDCRRELV